MTFPENHPHESPNPAVERLKQEVDRWVDFARTGSEKALEAVGLTQAFRASHLPADVCELPGEFQVTIDVPGCTAANLDLMVSGQTIQLKVLRPDRVAPADGTWRLQERVCGTLERHLTLPVMIDPESITAEVRDGLLKLTIHKAQSPTMRRVPIQ
jgi:HSP20 family protein